MRAASISAALSTTAPIWRATPARTTIPVVQNLTFNASTVHSQKLQLPQGVATLQARGISDNRILRKKGGRTSGRWNRRIQAHQGISAVSKSTGSSLVLGMGDCSSICLRAISASITCVTGRACQMIAYVMPSTGCEHITSAAGCSFTPSWRVRLTSMQLTAVLLDTHQV